MYPKNFLSATRISIKFDTSIDMYHGNSDCHYFDV